MSVHRLQLEQELRKAEAEREAEDLRVLERLRVEATLPAPPPARVVLVLENPYDECAQRIERWWKNRRRLPVTYSEVSALAREMRKRGRR